MDAALPAQPRSPDDTWPLTEQVLRRLPGGRAPWIVLWSLVPLISQIVFVSAIQLTGRPFDLAAAVGLNTSQPVLVYVCLVLLLGGRAIGRQAGAILPDLPALVDGPLAPDLFRRVGSARGPLVLTVVAAALIFANGWVGYGFLPPLAALPFVFTYMLPIMTFVWVYLTILVDIDRLGRHPLRLDAFPEDRSLGLEKIGSLASTGLGLVLAAAVPILLAGADEPVTLAMALAIVAVTVGVFVLSMSRLHRQMARARAGFVALARELYAEAYAPLRADPRVATLETQATALRAAQSLDERAHSVLTWPVDEGTLRFIVVVITGVITSLVVRGLFAAVGF